MRQLGWKITPASLEAEEDSLKPIQELAGRIMLWSLMKQVMSCLLSTGSHTHLTMAVNRINPGGQPFKCTVTDIEYGSLLSVNPYLLVRTASKVCSGISLNITLSRWC